MFLGNLWGDIAMLGELVATEKSHRLANEFPGDLAKVDLNKDGKIDLEEYAASRSGR